MASNQVAQVAIDRKRPDIGTLAAMIAHSSIIVRFRKGAPRTAARLPAGFEAVDVMILDWIAAEARRLGPEFVRM